MTESVTQHTKTSFFTLLKQALRGDVKDFTTGSIDRAIFLLAVPMVMEMVLESSFALVDIYFVNMVSPAAAATVGLTESSLTILYSLAWGLAMGATALIARRAGEKDFKTAGSVAAQVILIATAFSVLVSIFGILFPKEILRFMGADASLVEEHYGFTQLMLGSNIVIMLLFVNNGIFRGAGDASIAMKALIFSNIINIILDPLLIMGYGPFPKMGLMGAAVATTIGRGCGVIYQFYHLFGGNDLVKLSIKQFKADMAMIRSLLSTSSGAMFQFLIGSCSWIFLAKLIAESGVEATSGYFTAIRICIFTILPAWGIANAAATLTGQNLGAGHPERAERSVWRSAFLTLCFFALVGLLFFFFGETFMRFFTSNELAVKEGTRCLHVLAIGYIFFAYGMVLTQAFNGAGDTKTPTYINLFIYWLFQIPLAYLLAKYLNMGSMGVYMAINIAETALAIVSIIIFRKGKWKLVKV
ncbi:MAG: MATE family efflux transporter [Ferruginibacter sp.]|nr:MATE family efflux transporter [Chitinophagaceae bacterium]MBP6285436.1 MATE family efflux transporter [Ferruginibacter sp.]MBU9935062.1 MATE family efflux transporter [Ferruginibacter sp.]HQY11094.1 MATE family efflux transporter [Ferruginibacter sp.]